VNDRPLVSVVIPTYRRRDAVERCLNSLASQTLDAAHYEVIVVIDGSQDGTREMMAQFLAPYTLRSAWQENKGRAAACNRGICMAGGDVVVLLDDDMEAQPELLAAHWAAHTAPGERGVVGAAPIPVSSDTEPAAAFMAEKFNRHLERLAQPGHAFGVRDFYSGNFSIRRPVLLRIGLFDEDFKIYGNEDIELSLRLRSAGVELVFNAQALAYQHNDKDFAALARDSMAKGETSVLLAGKYPEITGELKLGSYQTGSLAWRLLRALLLEASAHHTDTTRQVLRVAARIAALPPLLRERLYTISLDYFYWCGVETALRRNRAQGQGPYALSQLTHDVRTSDAINRDAMRGAGS
jgi:GT2 family glycosyltransferase